MHPNVSPVALRVQKVIKLFKLIRYVDRNKIHLYSDFSISVKSLHRVVFLISAKIVSSRVKRAKHVENIKKYLGTKNFLFSFTSICFFYPGDY